MLHYNGRPIPETLREMLDPQSTCLVVWDVQNGLASRIFNQDELKSNLRKLLSHGRGKIPIVYTKITPPPREYRSTWALYSAMRRFGVKDPSLLPEFMAPGSPEREIVPEVAPQDGDLVLEKPSTSIFIGTNFENLLRSRDIRTILFAGIATEIGVEHSARDAAARGFFPVILEDCVSSGDRDAHGRSLANMKRMFPVTDSKEVIAALG